MTLDDGSYHEVDGTIYNPLEIPVASDRGGRISTIHVTKPFYTDAVTHARASDGGCVANSVTDTVKIVLTPAPGTPAVRSIHLLPPHVLLDRESVLVGVGHCRCSGTSYDDGRPAVRAASAGESGTYC
ncbi:MAG: hypothetical protein JWM41_896 [Gemmatimonadetes bacterium]|nr:hypothetical protein [Gemmatimonadota bacterium]